MRRKLPLQLCVLGLLAFFNYQLLIYRNLRLSPSYSYFSFQTSQNSTSPFVSKDAVLIKSERYGEEFCVSFNVTKAQRSFREDGLEPISLAVHTTSMYLNFVLEQVSTWDGPISLALFVDRSSQSAVEFLYNVHSCDEAFARKVSLHAVYRMTAFQDGCESLILKLKPCSEVTYKYTNAFVNRLVPPFTIYPINILRNIARLGAPSPIHLVADVEMIFSQDFAVSAKKIANNNLCETCQRLIVVRRFELDDGIKKVPRTIKDLGDRLTNRTIFEFHHKLFPQGHTIAGLWHWLRMSNLSNSPTVWEIPYKSPAWEPQVIMHASAPLSDEFFPTRIRDQQALAYELCRANYTFLLASQLFNVHRGVKRVATTMDQAVRMHQMKLRGRAYLEYTHRLDSLYPNTTERCSKFTM